MRRRHWLRFPSSGCQRLSLSHTPRLSVPALSTVGPYTEQGLTPLDNLLPNV